MSVAPLSCQHATSETPRAAPQESPVPERVFEHSALKFYEKDLALGKPLRSVCL